MFRCKVMALRVSGFYIVLLEHFKKSKSKEDFNKIVEVWGHYWCIDLNFTKHF